MSEFLDPLILIGVPIFVYILGRLLERGLVVVHRKMTSTLVFHEKIEGDSGILTIRTNSSVFLDEFTLDIKDRVENLLSIIKNKAGLPENFRIEFTSTDRIELECVVQTAGDKQMFINAYIGKFAIYFSFVLETEFENVKDFMQNTDFVIQTSGKKYTRQLFKKRVFST